MTADLNKVFERAMGLLDESKAVLAERLVEYLTTHIDPNLERLHLDIVKRRRAEIKGKQVEMIAGEEALTKVRQIINL